MSPSATTYFKKLRERRKTSHVYQNYQLEGLEIARILGDEDHKSLYIKLAKEGDPQRLRRLAGDIAERREVQNKGAYFMRVLAARKNDQTKYSRGRK